MNVALDLLRTHLLAMSLLQSLPLRVSDALGFIHTELMRKECQNETCRTNSAFRLVSVNGLLDLVSNVFSYRVHSRSWERAKNRLLEQGQGYITCSVTLITQKITQTQLSTDSCHD